MSKIVLQPLSWAQPESPLVLRGGSWYVPSGRLRTASRHGYLPGHHWPGNCDFRVVLEVR